jgi:8-oxo-dGTP pyrophosphatase MutT (NUDIX family)
MKTEADVSGVESFTLRLPPKLLLAYARFRRSMTLGVRAACFDGEGRVFLIKHSYVHGWYFPGGGVEPGETLEQSLQRELREEGCIRLDMPAQLFGIYLNRHISQRDHVALFVSRNWTQTSPPKIPNLEIADCGFFSPDALPDGTTAGTRRRLEEIVRGTPISAEW